MQAARLVQILTVAAALLLSAAASAQFGRGGGEFANIPARYMPRQLPDRNFVVCRLQYTSVRREPSGGGWRTDYPYGEINLTTRLSELTRTPVSRDTDGRPNHYVVRLIDNELFECPFTMASDVGTIGLRPDEVEQLRLYLLKGGFLWVDDFWGEAAWEQWSRELAKALPPPEYTIEDVPLTDPIFHSMLEVKRVPQVSGIGFWRATRGQVTSERGEESAVVHFRALRDSHGRIIAVMTHNTDVTNSWERETEDPAYFLQFSVEGYALGIDVLLYAMTH